MVEEGKWEKFTNLKLKLHHQSEYLQPYITQNYKYTVVMWPFTCAPGKVSRLRGLFQKVATNLLYRALCRLFKCLLQWNSSIDSLFTESFCVFLISSFLCVSRTRQSKIICIFSSSDIWASFNLHVLYSSISISWLSIAVLIIIKYSCVENVSYVRHFLHIEGILHLLWFWFNLERFA